MAPSKLNKRFQVSHALPAAVAVSLLSSPFAHAADMLTSSAPTDKSEPRPGISSEITGSIARLKVRRKDIRSGQLLQQLLKVKTARQGKILEQKILTHWRKPPNRQANTLYKAAHHAARKGNLPMAIAVFDMLAEKEPNWSEVYSQRAYYKYRMGELDSALEDVNKALQLQPAHFVALSGKFYILVAMRQHQEARNVLEVAVAIHPFIKERKLLGETTETESL